MAAPSAGRRMAQIEEAVQDNEYDEENALPGEIQEAPPWLAIDRLKAEYSTSDEEIVFQVFRQGVAGVKDLAFIKSVAPDQFSYEMLQRPPFNGGEFRVYIRQAGGAFKRNFFVNVEMVAVPTAAAPGGADTAALIAAMTQGFQMMSEQLARQHVAPAPQGMGIQETLQLLSALQPLTSAPQRERDPLDMLTKMIAIQRDLAPAVSAGGDVDGGTLMLQALKTFGEPLAQLMGTAAQQKATIAPAAIQHAPQTIQQTPPQLPATIPIPNPIQQDQSDMDIKIMALRPIIMVAAQTNADPYPYACMALDMLTPEELQTIILNPDWKTKLVELVPEAAHFGEWFAALRDCVLELLHPEPDPDTVPGDNSPKAA